MFYDLGGVETIVEKILYGKSAEMNCKGEINELFNVTLQGTSVHHRYLIKELCSICKHVPKGNNNERSKVRQIIIEQSRMLFAAQKIAPSASKNDIPKQPPLYPSRCFSLVFILLFFFCFVLF